jgi:hypothetical protein
MEGGVISRMPKGCFPIFVVVNSTLPKAEAFCFGLLTVT